MGRWLDDDATCSELFLNFLALIREREVGPSFAANCHLVVGQLVAKFNHQSSLRRKGF